jgi:hypothetical protein
MVFDKSWHFNSEEDFSEKYHSDPSFRAYLASTGVCSLIPLTLTMAGFGLGGVVGGQPPFAITHQKR